MPTYIVDAKDMVAQAVIPDADCPFDGRFFRVAAETPSEAILLAVAARRAGFSTVEAFKASMYVQGWLSSRRSKPSMMERGGCR